MKDLGRRAGVGAHGFGSAALTARRSGLALSGIQKVALFVSAVGLLTASAYVSVPFFPVPLTMQTLAVLLIGGLLGPTLGASAVAGYIALGAAGFPVFHNGLGGLAVLAGPTGGYLAGFIAAAFIMGVAVKWAGKVARPAAAAAKQGSLSGWASLLALAVGVVVASAAIYVVGVPWLALYTGGSFGAAVGAGLVPFLLGDLLKGAVAIGALRVGGGALARKGILLP